MRKVKQIVKQKSDLLASLEGFEPTTRCLEGSRSVQLSYRDNRIKYSMIGLE